MPTYPPIRVRILLFVVFLFIKVSLSSAAETAETEQLLRRITPPLAIVEEVPEKKDELYFDSYLEQSDILQGSRTGHWSEITNLFGYNHQNIRGYMSFSRFDRFDAKDYTANFGSYFTMKDSYVHSEIGFGWDVDYIYRLQAINEYGHKLIKDIYWQVGYAYRNYETGDTNLIYPGLIYYFGDHYMSADYGLSFIEGRGAASFGALKGSFAITKFMQLNSGIAFGQRLYDIFELKAKDEFGYILFAGLNVNIYKGVNFRAGYSYSKEDPKFIKRSVNLGLSVKF